MIAIYEAEEADIWQRLMEFPDDYVVVGTREQQLQLGNAVPPRLGYVVALCIRRELERLGVLDKSPAEAAV